MSNSSPFESVHERMGARFEVYDGWLLPADYGDVSAESAALSENCAAFDLSSFGRISIKGLQASTLIDNMLAGSTKDIGEDKWGWSIICDLDGNLVDIVRVLRIGGGYTIITSPSMRDAVISIAGRCLVEYGIKGVEIEDVTGKTAMLSLYGPKAVDSISNILPIDISDLQPGQIIKKTFFFISVTIMRGSCIGTDGLELICPVSAASLAAGAVEKYRSRENITPAGMNCLNVSMIRAGLPIFINSFSRENPLSPVAFGLKEKIDFDKDFFGRSAVLKAIENGIEYSLTGLKTTLKTAHTNLKVQFNNKEIGFCDMVAYSDPEGCSIGLAMIDNRYMEIKDRIQVAGDDVAAGAEIVRLPFGGDFKYLFS